jgi:lipopolysaccharide export system protein LptC
MTKVIVTKKPNFQTTHPVEALAAVCLQVCGGGLTVSQTAQAMELQSKVRTAGIATKNGYIIELQF